jgi:hypothetical protein
MFLQQVSPVNIWLNLPVTKRRVPGHVVGYSIWANLMADGINVFPNRFFLMEPLCVSYSGD